jgi:2-polyprenyl-6-methoxyphenol hydroxylase-like FAD-dependent oxidoreductase
VRHARAMMDQSANNLTSRQLAPDPASSRRVDVAIVGAGLAGSLAAAVLGRAGYRIALIDPYCVYPPEFRVEKIGGDQVELLRRLELLDCVAAVSTPFDQIINARRGQIIDRTYGPHYGIFYQDLVNSVRRILPNSVEFIIGQAIDLKADACCPQVVLDNQDVIHAKLVVLATGMAPMLRHKLGIVRKTVYEKHSISFGFNIAPAQAGAFDIPALTYYGDKISDCIDYLSLFPIGEAMRANLFTFRDPRDPWIRDLRRQPTATLVETTPGLQRFLGDFQVIGKVHNWTMDLYVLERYLVDGIVLIGDAFQTSCPAAGTGVSRLLTDVHQLCTVHLPRWFASDGIDATKLLEFYNDPVKQAADRRSSRLAQYRRSLTVDDSLRWKAHRGQAYMRRRFLGWLKRFKLVQVARAAAGSGSAARAAQLSLPRG